MVAAIDDLLDLFAGAFTAAFDLGLAQGVANRQRADFGPSDLALFVITGFWDSV
jgi:hypothetical protein